MAAFLNELYNTGNFPDLKDVKDCVSLGGELVARFKLVRHKFILGTHSTESTWDSWSVPTQAGPGPLGHPAQGKLPSIVESGISPNPEFMCLPCVSCPSTPWNPCLVSCPVHGHGPRRSHELCFLCWSVFFRASSLSSGLSLPCRSFSRPSSCTDPLLQVKFKH